MTNKALSEQICEICGIEPLYKIKHFNGVTEVWSPAFNKKELSYAKAQKQMLEQKEVYPDFENNNNKLKLIDLLIENDHIITMSKDYYAIGNGSIDFIEDCYDEDFEVEGNNLLESLYNYLTRWIKEKTSFKKEDGTMSEYIDTSYTLERKYCIFPEYFDAYLKDIDKIKQAIRQADWEI